MLWKDLIHFLGNRTIRIFCQAAPEAEVESLFALEGESAACEENTILCCRYSQLAAIRKCGSTPRCLFLLLDDASPDHAMWQGLRNVAGTASTEIYEETIHDMREIFREFRYLESAHHHLLEQIAFNCSFTELADEIARIYGHYSDIIDNSLNILAISEGMLPPTENLLKDRKDRYVKPNVVQYLRTSGNLRKMQGSKLPVLVEDEPRDTYAYTVAIGAGTGINLGFLCVFVANGETLTPVQLHFLPDTARLLSLEMQKNHFDLLNRSAYFPRLLTDLFQGRAPSGSTFRERFAVFGYDLRRWINLIVLRIDPGIPASTDLHVLCSTLQSLFDNSVYMIRDSTIIFLVSRHQSAELPEAQLTEWREYLATNRLRVGISDGFENLSLAAAHLEQAEIALTLGERCFRGESVHLYARLRLLAVVDRLAAAGDLRSYCFPPLLRLIEADRHEETPFLLETLRCYLAHRFSVAETCKALFIHRNTLYYRLNKIRTEMGCEFTLPDTVAQIIFTFSILQYLGLEDPGNESF